MTTVVLGASTNPARASNQATLLLQEMGFDVVPVGIKAGVIGSANISIDKPMIADVHTLTLYIGKDKQDQVLDYMVALRPKRVIFNPGTENLATAQRLRSAGIATEMACTLVLLRTGQYDSSQTQT